MALAEDPEQPFLLRFHASKRLTMKHDAIDAMASQPA
jgi:hypothetical protein